MKRNLVFLALMVCLASAVFAQTQADKDSALKYLESTKQGVIDATKGLSAAQWNFKPGPDRWSVAEVTEHIAAAEDFLKNPLNAALKGPARPAGEDVKAMDEGVLKGVPDRSTKFQAPEPLKPTNRFSSPDGSLKHFLEGRQQTEDFLKEHNDLRDHATDGPFGGKMDAYQWVLMIAAHSERHTKQILEVKADPNFPKM